MSQMRRADPAPIQPEDEARIEDYVNDKLQTHADLEGLDVLLENVRIQQDLLKKQLSDAEREAATAAENATKHAQDHAGRSSAWEQRQREIDRRTQTVTGSTTSDEAVRRFEPILQKLQYLDMAANVVDMLLEIEQLSTQAHENIETSPREALEPYLRIRQIANLLKQAQPAAEDAAPHLVDLASDTATSVYHGIKDGYTTDFEKVLKQIKWPSKAVTMEGDLANKWADCVDRLLELQEPQLKMAEETRSNESIPPLIPLLPLEIMVRPLELGFKYHFEGDKATNRLDKPEYFLSHVANLLNTYEEFFIVYLQPILVRRFKDTVLSLNPLYIDCTSALVTALLPMLRQKLQSFMPRISSQPQLFSHLIHELMSFDASLREDWGYTGGSVAEDWRGLTWDVLVKDGWFTQWLQIEKDFALERYESIIAPADSGEIDFDSVDPGITKPTKAAIRVNDLLETVTDRYRNLSSFSQKLHFLIDVQISIFDKFHGRLRDSLEAYLTMTSSLARTMQGVSKEEQAELQGLAGLDRLCRLYGSAEYLEKKMQDWSEDVFFVELWDELQERARSRGATIGRDLHLTQVAERTSSVVGANGNGNGNDNDAGGLFDETCAAYRRLRVRTEAILIDTVSQRSREALRPYLKSGAWSSLEAATGPSGGGGITGTPLAPSADLDAALASLDQSFTFLGRVLSDTALRRIARRVALAVQTAVWDGVLMRNRFTTSGTLQLQRDVGALQALFDRHVAPGQGHAGLRRLAEGVRLLSLPDGKGAGSSNNEDGEDGDDEDAWGWNNDESEATANGRPEPASPASPRVTRKDVEDRVYSSNEGARAVLEELGMQALSEPDARNLLERRVEGRG